MSNQATSFKAARAENFGAVVLNASHFAEQVSYQQAGGGAPANLTAICRLAVRDEQDEVSLGETETLTVKIANDPAGVIGLASRPARGDRLHRDQFGDPDDVVYACTGRLISSSDHWWKYEFQRTTLTQAGITR